MSWNEAQWAAAAAAAVAVIGALSKGVALIIRALKSRGCPVPDVGPEEETEDTHGL